MCESAVSAKCLGFPFRLVNEQQTSFFQQLASTPLNQWRAQQSQLIPKIIACEVESKEMLNLANHCLLRKHTIYIFAIVFSIYQFADHLLINMFRFRGMF